MLCFNACQKLGINPTYRKWNGKGSLVSFVVSLNLHRRHLDESQRGMVAAKVATVRQGERTDLPSIDGRLSQTQAATLLNVSNKTVERASKVLKHGDKKLIAAVESGEVTVSAAAQHVAAVTKYPELKNISREEVVIRIALC